jgi:hypothetical protein
MGIAWNLSCGGFPNFRMSENEYEYLEQALPGFSQARLIVKASGDSIRPLGFKGSKFDFYRFANRFRLATSFQGMNLEGFTEETTIGYSSLTRVFFTWSAFEGYTELADDQAPPYRTLFAHYPRHHIRDLAKLCREQDPQNLLGAFLEEHAQSAPQVIFLKKFREGNDLAVLTHAACIRHIFAHGRLTAHPNGLPAENMTAICDALSSFIADFIRSDFDRRVRLAEASLLHG